MPMAGVARVQKAAPDFQGTAVIDGCFEDVRLSDYWSKGWLVLTFIPQAFTFVCPTETIAFSEAVSSFKARGASVIVVSTDSEYSLLAWTNMPSKDGGLGPVDIPLLSDRAHKLSKAYGVLLEDEGIALRGMFLIDPNGIVRQITINDLPVGRSVEETLRLIDAFQFVEKYGEVCPANWQAGQGGMKATAAGYKEYMQSDLSDISMSNGLSGGPVGEPLTLKKALNGIKNSVKNGV